MYYFRVVPGTHSVLRKYYTSLPRGEDNFTVSITAAQRLMKCNNYFDPNELQDVIRKTRRTTTASARSSDVADEWAKLRIEDPKLSTRTSMALVRVSEKYDEQRLN